MDGPGNTHADAFRDSDLHFGDFVYKDESWNSVVRLADIFAARTFGVGLDVVDNICKNRRVEVFGSNALRVRGSGAPNEWVYWYLNRDLPASYMVEFNAVVHSDLTEFQLAFRHGSIAERIRFQIVDNRTLTFDVIRAGFFFDGILTRPYGFQLNRTHKITLMVLGSTYIFFVDGEQIMAVRERTYRRPRGGMALIFWDRPGGRPIDVDIDSFVLRYATQ